MSKPKHALVIGASMAGLLVARVLSDHFEQVTILERDKLPDGPEFRNGVPQARHAHALLAQGQEIMQEFFPTLAADLKEIGAPIMRWGTQTATLTAGGWTKRFDTGIVTNVCTRLSLEWLVRRRLSERTNVRFISQADVQSLLTTPDRNTVTGVVVESRVDHTTQTLEADFVIDASGRESKALEWLRDLGYGETPEETVNSFLGYATRWYEAPQDLQYDWQTLLIGTRPDEGQMRGGSIFHVEGDRWAVILVGVNKDYPPTDEDEFVEFARSLASPVLYEAIRYAKPISPVYGYRRTANRWRHYERLSRMPERFLVMGDAFCAFNPVYGQGMTVAAMQARELDRALAERNADLTGFSTPMQKRLAKVVNTPWLMSTGEDLRFPLTEGQRPGAAARFIQKYMDRLLRVVPHDERVGMAFLQVMNLTRPPTSLFSPAIAFTVLRHSLFSPPLDEHVNEPVVRWTREPEPLPEPVV
jgi:2-polyprenyl-6-methoxyphenol hydroxylase-like FAD-dependent oxidoreductase